MCLRQNIDYFLIFPLWRLLWLPPYTRRLRHTISNYLNIDTLTPLILNKLIEKIRVGNNEKITGQEVQEITIVWRFAGEV
ncbi:MAG: DUF4368 domain-containing protein [Acutalibacteraceae bacterium]